MFRYFLYWQAMTCNLQPATCVFYLPQTDLGWDKLTWFERNKLVKKKNNLKIILTCNIHKWHQLTLLFSLLVTGGKEITDLSLFLTTAYNWASSTRLRYLKEHKWNILLIFITLNHWPIWQNLTIKINSC